MNTDTKVITNPFSKAKESQLLKEAKTSPEQAMKDLYDLYLMFPHTSEAMTFQSKAESLMDHFLMSAQTTLQPLSYIIRSEKKINNTSYTTKQVMNVLADVNLPSTEWVDFDTVSLAVHEPNPLDVVSAIKNAFNHIFTPQNFGYAVLDKYVENLKPMTKQKGFFKYNYYQADDIKLMLSKQLPINVNKKEYLASAKKLINSASFKNEVQSNSYKLTNNGKHLDKTYSALANQF